VLSLRTVAGDDEKPKKMLCAEAHGFSLPAAVRTVAHQRNELERLCRHIARPALANERVSRTPRAESRCKLKSPYRDGTTLHRDVGAGFHAAPRAPALSRNALLEH